MLSGRSDFFSLAEGKLDWLDARTRLLAGDVANADTPGFRPRDLQSFDSLLSPASVGLSTTDPAHLSGPVDSSPTEVDMRGEQAPDGNAVSIEHQMRLVADTNSQQQLTTTLYRKYLSLMTTALGGGSSG